MTATAPTALNPENSNRYCPSSGNDLGENRIYDYGFRDYSPVAMRFTTVDPVKDSFNWYAYAGNDPINFIDPFGLTDSDAEVANNEPNWDLVKEGLQGMAEGAAQVAAGAALTQADSILPGPMDVIGAVIVVEGAGDIALNYGKTVEGFVGVEDSNIPGDLLNDTVDALSGNDSLGDLVE